MSQILDAFGKPATYYAGTFASASNAWPETSQDSLARLPRPDLHADIQRLLSRQKHRALLGDSRYIVTSFPLVEGAVQQKADYVSSGGWTPVFTGRDREWGKAAQDALRFALDVSDVRGPVYDFNKNLSIACRLFDVDGDFFTVHSTSDTGFPQIQWIEAHRIGCRNGERIITSGPYKDLPILNGVIYNRVGRPVAIRYLADDPAQDTDVSLRDCEWWCDPKWFSDGRPLPSIAYAILDWYDVKQTRGFEKAAQAVNSALSLIVTNETGKAPPGINRNVGGLETPTAVAASTEANPVTELLAGGLIRYVKFGSGSVQAHNSNRPGDSWLKFDERIVAGAFYGMGWRIEMFDLSKLSGAPTRGFQDNINTTIHSRWAALRKPARRVVLRTVAALVARGDLARHPEWDQWDFPPPVDFTVDANKDSQTDRSNIAFGLSSIPAAQRRLGYSSPETVLREQAEWLKLRNAIAKEHGVDPAQLGTPAAPGISVPQPSAPAA